MHSCPSSIGQLVGCIVGALFVMTSAWPSTRNSRHRQCKQNGGRGANHKIVHPTGGLHSLAHVQ